MRETPPTPHVILRPPQPQDIETRLSLPPSPSIYRMYGGDSDAFVPLTRAAAEEWMENLLRHPCAWIIAEEDVAAGEIRLDNIHPQDRRARMALGLFDEKNLGRGIGRAAIRLALKHAFETLALHRIDLRVLAFNHRAIRCYTACGFMHEGTERQSAFIDGVWHDDHIMGILTHEYDEKYK